MGLTRSKSTCSSLPGRTGNYSKSRVTAIHDVHWERTHTTEHTGAIVSVHCAFSRVSDACSIALTAEQDWVHERLGLVQVMQEQQACSHKTEDDGEVVGNEIVRQSHGWVHSASSSVLTSSWNEGRTTYAAFGAHGSEQG